MGRGTTIWIRALAVAFGLAATASADRLELRTGDVFSGTILRVTESSVSIQLESGGILSFRLSGVRLIQKRIPGTETSEIILDRRGEPDEGGDPQSASIRPLLGSTSPDEEPSDGGRSDGTTPPRRDDPPTSAAPLGPVTGGPPPVASGKPVLSSRVSSSKHGISVAPPRGYAPWDDACSPRIPVAFKNPRNNSTFVVEWRVSTVSIEEVKNQSLRDYSERFRVFHVVRDAELPPEATAGGTPEGWILEVESQVGILTIRQIQAFYKLKSEVFVLTYSGAATGFEGLRPSIEASLKSFRFDGVADPDAPQKPWSVPTKPSDDPPLGY